MKIFPENLRCGNCWRRLVQAYNMDAYWCDHCRGMGTKVTALEMFTRYSR